MLTEIGKTFFPAHIEHKLLMSVNYMVASGEGSKWWYIVPFSQFDKVCMYANELCYICCSARVNINIYMNCN